MPKKGTDLSSLQEPYDIQRLQDIRDFFIQSSLSPLRVGFHKLVFARIQSSFSTSQTSQNCQKRTISSPEKISSFHPLVPLRKHSPRPCPRKARRGYLEDLSVHLCCKSSTVSTKLGEKLVV